MSYRELEAVVEAANRLQGLRHVASQGGEHPSLPAAETALEVAAMSLTASEAFREKVAALHDEARRRGIR